MWDQFLRNCARAETRQWSLMLFQKVRTEHYVQRLGLGPASYLCSVLKRYRGHQGIDTEK